MIIINKIQKAIYDCLDAENTENFQKLAGIFTYIEKNTKYPYIFIKINKLEDKSTFFNSVYNCNFSINIYDKNTSNGFIVNISEEIKELFKNLSNFSITGYNTIDIEYNNFNVFLENNDTVWHGELIYDFTIRQN